MKIAAIKTVLEICESDSPALYQRVIDFLKEQPELASDRLLKDTWDRVQVINVTPESISLNLVPTLAPAAFQCSAMSIGLAKGSALHYEVRNLLIHELKGHSVTGHISFAKTITIERHNALTDEMVIHLG